VIFGEGKDSIENSISFLQNYLVTLQNIAKGKATQGDLLGEAS
jgi:hypothetical protein